MHSCSSQRCREPARRLPGSRAPASAPPARSPVPGSPGDRPGAWPLGVTNLRISPIPAKTSLRSINRPPPPSAAVWLIVRNHAKSAAIPAGGAASSPACREGPALVRGCRHPALQPRSWDPALPRAAPVCALQAPRGPAAPGGPLAELGSWCVQLPCPFPGQGQVRAGREPCRV